MMNIEIKRATNEEIIDELDEIRAKSFGFKSTKNNHYTKNIKNGNYLEYYMEIDNIVVGGCIVSNYFNSLYIDKLFIDPSLQRKGLGKKLLVGVLGKKKEIDEYYNTSFNISILEDVNNTKELYKSLGYKDSSYYMKKRVR